MYGCRANWLACWFQMSSTSLTYTWEYLKAVEHGSIPVFSLKAGSVTSQNYGLVEGCVRFVAKLCRK